MKSRETHRMVVKRRRAFTVMETLIAIALLLALGSVIFGFLFDLMRTRQAIVEHTSQHRVAAMFVERLESDLFAALAGGGRYGAGIEGDEFSLRLLTSGVAAGSPAAGSSSPAAFSDLIRAEYRFSESNHLLEVRRQFELNTLNRGSQTGRGGNANAGPNSGSVSGSASGPSSSPASGVADWEPLEARIYRAAFRFHDGREWGTSFNSEEADGLPAAIEIAIWFQPWPGSEWNEVDAFGDWEPDAESEGDREPERLTFDPEGTFDEFDYALREDRDFGDRELPRPDVYRIIVLPDAKEDSNEGGETLGSAGLAAPESAGEFDSGSGSGPVRRMAAALMGGGKGC